MKITLEHLGNKVTEEHESAVDITDVMDLFEDLLIRVGFDRERINAAYVFKAREAMKDDDGDPDSENKYLF